MTRQSPPGGTPNRPPCQNCAAAEARAEAWRKAASDMLDIEIEARDKERLREHFRKTEALTRDAAASGRALHATAEDLAIVMRSTAQPAAGPPVNPPVASADPELAALLREIGEELFSGEILMRRYAIRARIDSALSRLAGPGK